MENRNSRQGLKKKLPALLVVATIIVGLLVFLSPAITKRGLSQMTAKGVRGFGYEHDAPGRSFEDISQPIRKDADGEPIYGASVVCLELTTRQQLGDEIITEMETRETVELDAPEIDGYILVSDCSHISIECNGTNHYLSFFYIEKDMENFLLDENGELKDPRLLDPAGAYYWADHYADAWYEFQSKQKA